MKERRISVITLLMLLISVVAILSFINYSNYYSPPSLHDILFNELMLFVQVGATVLSIKMFKGSATKMIDNYLGLGDIVLLGICGLCFSSESFFVFYILSLITGIMVFMVTTFFIKRKPRELPFAAVLSMVFIVLSVLSFSGYDQYSPFRF